MTIQSTSDARWLRFGLLVGIGVVGAALSLAVPRAAGQETKPAEKPFYKFVNNTGGRWKDSEIFWSLDSGTKWHAITDEPTAPCPKKPGRIYFSMGPHPANFDDLNSYWDFAEFIYNNGTWQGNSTQADGFCLPFTLEMGSKMVGIKEPRSKLFERFAKECPKEFKDCVKGDFWIVPPAKAGFDKDGPQAAYFDKYVDEIWETYKTEKPTPSGKYTGKVVDGALIFTPVDGKGKTYKCLKKPSTQDILLGEGTLGQNLDFCRAFNRHVAEDPADFRDKTKFYLKEPCNWYAKFMHENAIDNKAYGFSVEEAGDASFFSAKGDSLTVTFYWDGEKKDK